MRIPLLALIAFCLPASLGSAGAVFEFDGKKWDPEPGKPGKLFRAHGTVCLIAPAETPMKHFAELLPEVYGSHCRLLKLQLRGQLTSVTMKRPGPEFQEKMESSGEAGNVNIVMATTGPEASYLSRFSRFGDDDHKQARLTPDLEGVQHFLNVAAESFEPVGEEGAKRIPPLAMIARSNCSFGQLVQVLQLLKQSGAETAAIVINDELPDPHIVIDMDKSVPIPVAPKRQGEDPNKGRIVVNIDAEGKVTAEDGSVLTTDEEITAYFKARRKELIEAGLKPRIHLRGERTSLFRHSRRIIRRGAEADLTEVIFVAWRKELEQAERDLDMTLPSSKPDEEAPPLQPLFIKIDKKGAIFINTGPAEEQLDKDPAARDLPLLGQRIAMYSAAARAAGLEPIVQLYVEGDSKQQRVVDVLNALAKAEISKVTFTDLVEEE